MDFGGCFAKYLSFYVNMYVLLSNVLGNHILPQGEHISKVQKVL